MSRDSSIRKGTYVGKLNALENILSTVIRIHIHVGKTFLRYSLFPTLRLYFVARI